MSGGIVKLEENQCEQLCYQSWRAK